ncbi:hypothetical protein Taro_002307 [Colocasia esculenta]|uniref:SAWADEE domain-containing protein n=1 Tax=Colocasia esculenta TaxID=4460 RepID=A0A843TGU3_COLES|nr:hypothetical protein [Colocasia esculenta]
MPPKDAAGAAGAARVTGPPPGVVDFRCSDDDAWYSVGLRLEAGGCAERRGRPPVEEQYLRVMYCNFPEVCDERFWAGAFADETAVEEFSSRFRASSVQLQDGECRSVAKGAVVCASYAFGESDLRFYDAVVEEVLSLLCFFAALLYVCSSDHEVIEGDEVCTCTFVLSWQHGPNAGGTTTRGIEHVSLLRQGVTRIDPSLELFLEHARKNIKSARQSNTSVGCNGTYHDAAGKGDPNGSDSRPSDTNRSQQLDNREKAVSDTGRTSIQRQRLGQDVDLGGKYLNNLMHANVCFYFILIENLEKYLSPKTVVDFIYQQTSIVSQAHIFPSLMSECYTRGTIILETKEKADKLLSFLQNPQQLIVSSRGRPWVITEGEVRFGAAGLMFKFEKQLGIKSEEECEMKVVHAGSNAFTDAKKLQQLFTEFHDHLQRLHKRLVSEETELLQQQSFSL